ncbi:2OG-Fe(II) oxygenase [Amycolatopsis vastitatis]|uniref:Prolyl 4-hydroxylase alpha subunit Fe(2+) 2OG dioxygenase domain-containing protein n=1 Tax=Amycolatopsis vastitatis TaxID=1905142 RepID=A0A229TB42_9PSEU|nr:2OG-Fe(II) oxygenase [Amycolatopsis vastitatis]OXM68486.1 hypothetical protein CF165_13340 [Amycolatopsis vastitatis]
MKRVLKDQNISVIDGYLGEREFGLFTEAVQFTEYTPMHGKAWVKAYGVPGGPIFESALVVRGHKTTTPPTLGHVGRLMDRFTEPASPLAALFQDGTTAEDHYLTGRIVLFGRGAGLRWHADASEQIGAYIYYCHPQWHTTWGGELMVMDGSSVLGQGLSAAETNSFRKAATDSPGSVVGPDYECDGAETRRADIGTGRFVMAKPDRLVVLTGTAEHRVAPVTAAAGDHLRCAVTGFVVRKRAN